jgi:DNA-directed RNA polymerase specialized sigma24 family protein
LHEQRTSKEVGMSAIRDREYAAVVEGERPLIQATAYLLTGDPAQAEQVVQLVFAELYGRWPSVSQPRLVAIRAVVHAARAPVQLPWEHRKRFELVDGSPPLPVAEAIVADLRMLAYDQRVAIVLARFVGLTNAEIAEVLGRPVGDVLSVAGRARNMLAAGNPARASDQALAQELRDAIPFDMRESHGSANDLAHGRRLARRRWIQRGSAAVIAVVLIVVAVALIDRTHPSVPQAAPPLPTSVPFRQSCDPSSATCRAQILFKWRSKMVEVTRSYLDPTGEYFSGYGYSYNSRYDTPGFWTGQGGALAFEMFRLDKGATEVYLQIASSRRFAVRCGATTHQQCSQMRFMDGNLFLVSESTLVRGGIEVQYSPSGEEVITVIARNTQRGKVLDISRGDLIKLVQDERLHLPQRCCYRR